MKELKSDRMRSLLAQGARKAKRGTAPREGSFRSIICKTLSNGWHYQVEYVHDQRIRPVPFIVVYSFRPGLGKEARSADYYLSSV